MARDQVLPQDGDAVISAPPAVPQSDIPNIDVLKLYEQFPTSGTTGERGSRTTSIPKPEQQNLQTAQTGEPKRPEAYGFPVVSDLVDPAASAKPAPARIMNEMQHFVLDQFDEFARKKNLTDEQKKAVKPELDRVVQSVHHLSQPHWLEDRLKELDQKLIEMGVKAPGDAPAVTATTQQSHLVNRLEMSLGPLSMNLSTQQLAEVRPQLQSLITAFGNDRKPGELLSREQIEASAALDRKLVQMGHRPLQAVSPMQIDFNERFAKFVKDNKLTDEQIKKLQPDAQWAIKELDVKYDGSTTIYHSAYNRLDELGREMEKMGFDRKALLTQQELDGIKRTLEYQADPDGLKVIMQRMEEIHKKRQSGESSAEEEEEFRLWEDHLLRMLKLKTRVAV